MQGQRLSEIRKDHGHTQEQLAKMLLVSKHTVQSWEQGKSHPTLTALMHICKLYQVSADYLLGLNDKYPLYDDRFSLEEERMIEDFQEYLLFRRKKNGTKAATKK